MPHPVHHRRSFTGVSPARPGAEGGAPRRLAAEDRPHFWLRSPRRGGVRAADVAGRSPVVHLAGPPRTRTVDEHLSASGVGLRVTWGGIAASGCGRARVRGYVLHPQRQAVKCSCCPSGNRLAISAISGRSAVSRSCEPDSMAPTTGVRRRPLLGGGAREDLRRCAANAASSCASRGEVAIAGERWCVAKRLDPRW